MISYRHCTGLLLLLVGSSCSDFGTGPSTSIPFRFTEADRREALYLALHISGELCPSQSTIDGMAISINTIRYIFRDSIRIDPMIRERLAARFEPPWAPGEAILVFDSLTFCQVQNGTYAGWYLLPLNLWPISIEPVLPSDRWCRISFPQDYHPQRVAEMYMAALPGVRAAFPNNLGLARDQEWPVEAWVAAGEMNYVFRRLSLDDYEDRPELYFRYIDGRPIFVGVPQIDL